MPITDAERTALMTAAMRAPSSHNTQPWRFGTDGDRIVLFTDRSRILPVNDPDGRELTISCGAALANLTVAARSMGLVPTVERSPAAEDGDVFATVSFERGEVQADAGALAAAIDVRHTTRGPFTDAGVDGDLVDELTRMAAEHGAWLHVVEREDREPVAALVAEGDRRLFADREWRRELASWMRPRRGGDGLSVPAPAAPFMRLVLSSFDLGSREAKKDRELALAAPVLAVLGTDADRPLDRSAAGEALERVLLLAAGRGVQAGFLNQPCQVDVLRPRLAETLGRTGHPQVMIRLGHPMSRGTPSPRRPMERVVADPG